MARSYDIEKLGKTSKYSAIASLLGFLVIASSLVYGSYRLYHLRRELSELEQRKAELLAEIEQLEEKAKKEFELARNDVTEILSNLSNIQPQSLTASELTQQMSKLEQIDRQIQTAEKELDSPRLYIHIQEESHRERAKGIAEKLKEMGYFVPGIERVATKVRKNQLRYFRSNEKTEASEIADILKGLVVGDVEPVYITGYDKRAKPRHYEIWFASEF